ncbi:MAG: ATP-dependent Clp protease ATP-binding subunit ClpA [Spirochaetaceae bacterium]|nr:ATP-dependent Clp protease ATP-binding subunit ClpA [Spirochaetaceae bacterium]
MELTKQAQNIIHTAYTEARMRKHEYILPEHLLYAALNFDEIQNLLTFCGADLTFIRSNIERFFTEKVPVFECEPKQTEKFQSIINNAVYKVNNGQKERLDVSDIIVSLYDAKQNFCGFFMQESGLDRDKLLQALYRGYEGEDDKSQKFFREGRQNGAAGAGAMETDGAAGSQSAGREKRSALERYALELVSIAKEGALEPVIGREKEIERTIQVLCRRLKNNPIHVGDSGVGKTAVTEGIAQRIADGNVPPVLKGFSVYSLDMGALLAGTRYRGDFEDRVKKIVEEIQKKQKAILFIDEIHTLVGAGSASGGALDASNMLKPALASGKLRCIGSTTHEEYKKYFVKDQALSRRFQKIDIDEPSEEDSIKILNGIKPKYEEYHHVRYTDDAVNAAVRLSAQYITERRLPDKAIDVLDEAGAYAHICAWKTAGAAGSSEDAGGGRVENGAAAGGEGVFKNAVEGAAKTQQKAEMLEIGLPQIETVVARIAKIPEKSVGGDEKDRLRVLEAGLKKSVFGQDEAVKAVVRAVKRSRAGFRSPQKTVANFLFAGPTGVGKTELAKNLASLLGLSLHRFDMSEYQEKHSVSRLIGSPPGYVGYEEGGLLTDAVRKQPHCVLLLDEIEKAHVDIYNILLQVMDYATLTDNNGRKADFRNVFLIMTSNAGAREIGKNLIGFGERTLEQDGAVTEAVEKIFTPEFRNRLDAVVKFNRLSRDVMLSIAGKEISEFAAQLMEKGVFLTVTDACREQIAREGYSLEFGARNVGRVIEEKIKSFFVDEVLFGSLSSGGNAVVDWDGEYRFSVKSPEKSLLEELDS